MSVILPRSLPAVTGWQLVNWRDLVKKSAPAPASGIITVELDPVPPDELWLLDRMVVQCTSTKTTTAKVYSGTVDPAALIEATLAGNLNAGDWPGGLLLRSMTSLIVQWTGASTGAVAILTGQARIMRRAG
jgi:hypothetical protein